MASVAVFDITEQELTQIVTGGGHAAQDLAFSMFLAGIFVTTGLAIPFLPPDASVTWKVLLPLVTAGSGLAAIYCGARWWREKKRSAALVDGFRARAPQIETYTRRLPVDE